MTTNELINKAEALGYKLRIEDGYAVVSLIGRENHSAEVRRDHRGKWVIQTTSYGTLSPEAVDLLNDGLERAPELFRLLNEAGL